MTRIIKQVQRYGIKHIPTDTMAEVGINTRVDAQYSCDVHNAMSKSSDFSVVETTPVTLVGTKDQIEGWLGRDLEAATAPPLKEQLRPKCPPFVFQSWGYQKGEDGITHDAVWFTESALKSKGTSLLKRISGTKSKPRARTLEQNYQEFCEDNPVVKFRDRIKFIQSQTGMPTRPAKQYILNMMNR